jgi:O-antigen ligase
VLLAAIFAWGRRGLALVAVAAAVVAVGALAVPNVRHDVFGNGRGLNSATGGRGKLVRKGIRLAVNHPVVGVGVGGFKRSYAELTHLKGREPKAAASHNTPVTVAAETGIPGLLLFGWLLGAGLLLAFRRFARDLPGLTALTCGLVFASIAVHSLFYNAFFEDPTIWAALGLAAVAARQPLAGDRDEPPQPAQLDREVEPEREQDQRVDGNQQDGAGERNVERLPEHR